MELLDKLKELSDKEYAKFQAKLTPNIDSSRIIGIRVPILRKFAKEIKNESFVTCFLNTLPHYYYDENMLHSLLISDVKNLDECYILLDKFLPFVNNWAVCDILSPKVLKKDLPRLMIKIKEWVKSGKTYTIRFGIEMLMSFFLDKEFKEEYLEIALIDSDEYYVNMMAAWFYATALVKQWDYTIKYIKNNRLSLFVHNKTIQKAIESYRITDEKKAYLRTFKKTK